MLRLVRSVLGLCLLLFPSVLCKNLRCYYSPLLETEKKFDLIETECPPTLLCFKSDGRYGNHSALTGRGCMAMSDCSQMHDLKLKDAVYNMSYSCCDWAYCNSCLRVTANPTSITVTLVTAAAMVSRWD